MGLDSSSIAGGLSSLQSAVTGALATIIGQWGSDTRLYTLSAPSSERSLPADLMVESFVLHEAVSQPFTLYINTLVLNAQVELKQLLRLAPRWAAPGNLRAADRLLRIRFSLEILRTACPRLERGNLVGVEALSKSALTALKEGTTPDAGRLTEWEEDIRRYFSEHGFETPFALANPHWWISLAVVEMQPVASPR